MLSFYDGFFLNLCVLIASLFVYKEILKKISVDTQDKGIIIIQGLLSGLLATILMRYGIETGMSSIIDLRIIPLMLAVTYGNGLTASMTAALIIFARFAIGVNIHSLTNVFFILISWALFYYCIRKIKHRWLSIVTMLSLSNIVYIVLRVITRGNEHINLPLVVNYWAICILGGIVSVYIMDYLNKSDIIFKENRNFAYTDPLTGLNNIRSFDIAFNKAKRSIMKSSDFFSIILLDIDYFKQVNDTYGHLEGDVVLKKLATILKMSQVPGDVVSRNGGEEFTILLHNCSPEEAFKRAEALRKVVENSFFVIKNGTKSIYITISIGIASYNDATKNIDQLYDHADQALYAAKKSGRNKVCSYS